METPSVREYATQAIRYWEPRRAIYNLVLGAEVVAYFVAGCPASKQHLIGTPSWFCFFGGCGQRRVLRGLLCRHFCAEVWLSRTLAVGTLDFVCRRSYFCSDPNAVRLCRNVSFPIRLKKPLQPSFGAGHSRGFHSISCSHLADGFGEIISHCTFGEA